MKLTFLLSSLSLLTAGLLSSCASSVPLHEKPIRPTSENSNIAHGYSSPTGGGLGGGFDALSR